MFIVICEFFKDEVGCEEQASLRGLEVGSLLLKEWCKTIHTDGNEHLLFFRMC